MKSLYEQRREELRKKIRYNNLDAYLVLHPANRYYLSGFELHDPQCNESAGCLLVTAKGPDWLCTDPRYMEEAKTLWPESNLFIYKNNRTRQLSEFFTKIHLKELGFETKIMSHEFFAALKDSLNLIPHRGLVEELRLIKDDAEIDFLRESCAMNHEVLNDLPSRFTPGQTEADLAWIIEKNFREKGASELAFPSIVAFGPNAARPHFQPGRQKLKEETPILVDTGCRVAQYCSDQTRTYWLGSRPAQQFLKTMDLVRKAQKKAIESLRPGQPVKELYNLVLEFFAEHGTKEHFTHALGHGIGLETHESPALGSTSEEEIKSGMVITIEPGLYYPEWGGVRWENMVVVNENGAEIL